MTRSAIRNPVSSARDRHVVTAFLHRAGRLLVLKRSRRVATFPGRWAAVSGSLAGNAAPIDQALREIREETGLAPPQVVFEAAAPALVAGGQRGRFVVHPSRYRLDPAADPRLDWEHTELRWVDPDDLQRLRAVPRLGETWARAAPRRVDRPEIRARIRAIRNNRTQGASTLAAEGLALLGDAALAVAAGDEAAAQLDRLARALAAARPGMASIGGLAARWWEQVAASGGAPRDARRAAAELIDAQRQARDCTARQTAALIAGAARIATGSYSSLVLRALRSLARSGARPQVLVAASGAGADAHGRRMARELRDAGLDAAVMDDALLDRGLEDVDLLLLGADALDPAAGAINGWPSALLLRAAEHVGARTVVTATTERVVRSVCGLELEPGFDRFRLGASAQIVTEEGVMDAARLASLAEARDRSLGALTGRP